MRPEMKSTQNQISTHHKKNSVYITFYCGGNEIKRPFSIKANHFCFDEINACFLLYGFISRSVYMILYHPKRNLISGKMTALK